MAITCLGEGDRSLGWEGDRFFGNGEGDRFFSQNRRAFIIENLLVVNRFIPKSATKLTAGLARYAMQSHFMYLFFSNQSDRASTDSILLHSPIHPFAMYTAMPPVILIHNRLK
jgi:hypothetical protein